jgi:hypothetical protein
MEGKRKVFVPADPAQALNILGRLSEFILPKLNRTEVTGADGEKLIPPSIGITFDLGGPGRGGAPIDEREDENAGAAAPGAGAAGAKDP